MLHHIKQCHAEVTRLMRDQQQFKGTGTRIPPLSCSVRIRNPLTDLGNHFQLLPRRFVPAGLQVPWFRAVALRPPMALPQPGLAQEGRDSAGGAPGGAGQRLRCTSPGCKDRPG